MLRCLRFSLGVIVPAGLLPAQPWGDSDSGAPRVILYADADFGGDFIELQPGDRLENFADVLTEARQSLNDKVSSIRIEGRVELVVYADSRFRGDSFRIRESLSNLADIDGPSRKGDWNDLISSATVSEARRQPRRWSGGTGRGDRRGARVELYSDANYRGSRLVLVPGDRVRNLADVGFDDESEANDRISSIRIFGDVRVTVHADGEFRGESFRTDQSIPNLAFRRGRRGGGSWNDAISSIAVGAGDDRPAEEIVRRAYQDILEREPDESGLATYTRLIEEEGWTEDDVRETLRNSEEYRSRSH